MPTVDKMTSRDSVRLGGLEEPALFVDPDGQRILANDAAVDLLGQWWREVAEGLVGQVASKGRVEEWHHGVLIAETPDSVQCAIAVHTTRDAEGSQLLLLQEARASDIVPSAGLDEMLEGISDCFFAVDTNGVFLYANSNAAEFFDKTRDEVIGKRLEAVSGDSRFAEAFHKAIDERESVSYDSRLADTGKWIEIRAYPVEAGMAVYFSDITQRIDDQERMVFYALHDTLTRLPNRRYLQEHLVRAVAKARRGQTSALLFLDMDRFKLVNDTVGHAAGDAVLVEFAGVVCCCIREEDMLARFGGDEFALLLDGTDGDGAELVADRIHSAVKDHEFRVGPHTFSLGVSIGLAEVDGSLDEGYVMSLADDAMYQAKNRGGERTCRCSMPPSPEALGAEGS